MTLRPIDDPLNPTATVPRIEFHRLPDDARLWTFAASRPLSEPEERALLDEVDAFLEAWKAHGTPLTAAREWRDGRFLLVGVDERSAPPSGCSIDAMVRVLKDLEDRLDVTLVDHAPVWYRDGDEVRRASRSDFGRRAREGGVDLDTVVFDPTVTRVGDLREGRWERPAREGWHARAFFDTAPAGA